MSVQSVQSDLLEDDLHLDPEILIKAKEGDSFAQLDIGKAYYCSPSIPSNNNCEKTLEWFLLSAQQKNMEAQFRIGDLYAFGIDEYTAYDWYLKSALQGYPRALTRLHNLYHAERGMYCRGQRDAKEGEWATVEYKTDHHIRELNEYRVEQLKGELTKIDVYFSNLLNSCRQQIKDEKQKKQEAYLTLGFLYQHGYGIRQITSRAVEFYTLAAESGSIDAEFNLGYIYHHHAELKWNYRESFKWYTKAAENGSSSAQEGLAFLYLKGLGTGIDNLKALYWYTQAAESRTINAMISLASIYRKGDIVEKDNKTAIDWYTRAIAEGSTVAQSSLELLYNNTTMSTEDVTHAEKSMPTIYSKKGLCSRLHEDTSHISDTSHLDMLKKPIAFAMRGDGHAMLDIGMKYYNGTLFTQDKDIAFRWIRNAAKAGLNDARRFIAKMYYDGDCVEQNYHKASIWYMRAAKNDDDKAQYQLGLMYQHGLGVRKDPLEASKWYTFSADKNNADSLYQLGILRETGEGLTQDTQDALKLYTKAVRQKHPQSLYQLSRMYQNGSVVKKNEEMALFLLKMGAQLGNLDCQMTLTTVYRDSDSIYYNVDLTYKYYKMASDNGSPEARYKFALFYLDGVGVKQDLTKAYYLLKEAAELGYPNAINIFNTPINYSKSTDIDYGKIVAMFVLIFQNDIDNLEYNLGWHYNQDITFMDESFAFTSNRNPFLAETWFNTAAETGDVRAQYELGLLYADEETENYNPSKASEWLEKAYENESINAAYKLAYMYMDGVGVSQDFNKAFCLFNEASVMGHDEAYKVLHTFNEVEEEVTESENITKVLEIAAASGNTVSQYKLGMILLKNTTLTHNIQEAMKWLEMASDRGFITASYHLGLLLEGEENKEDKEGEEGEEGEKTGSEKDYQTIIRLYQLAADKGHEKALFRLAQLYHHGKHIESDYLKAYEYYTLASKQGYQPAQIAIDVSSKSFWIKKRDKLIDHPDDNVNLNYEPCFQMWEYVADKGDIDLQYKVGIIYEEKDVYSTLSQAAIWYSRAAEGYHDSALYRLGRLYEIGLGVEQDYTEAIRLYEHAGELGNNKALYQLGVIHQFGRGVEPDSEKAIVYYRRSAEKENSQAQFTLGQLFEKGELMERDILEAVRWYSVSDSRGYRNAQDWLSDHYDEAYTSEYFAHRQFHLLSQILDQNKERHTQNDEFLATVHYRLGYMYCYGHGTPLNYPEALDHFRNAIALFQANDNQFFSHIVYERVSPTLKDAFLKKLEMFEASAERLFKEEIYELGLIYYHGIELVSDDPEDEYAEYLVPSDLTKSSTYFKMIIHNNELSDDELYSQSSYYLGMHYILDSITAEDDFSAKYYFTGSFHSGYAEAEEFLTFINSNNEEREGSKEALLKRVYDWHMEHEDAHDLQISYNIGLMYYEGLGTDQDHVKAVEYIQAAAIKNLKSAQYLLGLMYKEGHGVKQSTPQAIEWFTRAAHQNGVLANVSLGDIYFYDEDVDYKLAIQYYRIAAERGHAGAQCQLGYIYENGFGVNRDVFKAIEWYKRSVAQRHQKAAFYLGCIYFYGRGVPRNYAMAVENLTIAAEEGDADAQVELGVIYETTGDKDYARASEWYIKAAEQDSTLANYNLALLYESGNGVKVDKKKAFQCFLKAAEQDYASAQYSVGRYYDNGEAVEQDYEQAVAWYTKAASYNQKDAIYCLGNMYFDGRGVDQDCEVGIQYYNRAADMGESHAQVKLGVIYSNGQGVEKDYERAIEWFQRAANQNNTAASYHLAEMYYLGQGVEKDYKTALLYFTMGGEQHDNLCQLKLGLMYRDGVGVEKNTKLAIQWFLKAINEGNRIASFHLGTLYLDGRGVDKDYTRAMEYITSAADQGEVNSLSLLGDMYSGYDRSNTNVTVDYTLALKYYTEAAGQGVGHSQYRLGCMYEKGFGVEADMAKAIEMYTAASKQDNPLATNALGNMYFFGRGMEKDDELAFKYYNLAVDQGDLRYQLPVVECYFFGRGVERDQKKAIELALEIEDKVNITMSNFIGEMYHCAEVGIQNLSKAFEYYKQVKEGDSEYKFVLRGLGLLYEFGDGVERDYEQSLDYYKRSFDMGSTASSYNIALLYYYGKGVAQSFSDAIEWFSKMVENPPDEENIHVFVEVENDIDGTPDDETPTYARVYEPRIYGEAHYYLGFMYLHGQGIDKDNEKALNHFRIAESHDIEKAKKYLLDLE